jgi:hypothetical protein
MLINRTAVSAGALSMALSFGACGGSSQPAANAPPAASAASDPAPAAGVAAATVAGGDNTAASGAAAPAASPASPAAAPAGSAAPPPAAPDRNLDDIRAIIAGNRDLFRSCYTHVAAKNPGLHGAYVLHFVLGPDGAVKSAEADQAKSEIHAPEMTVCAINVLKTLKFPPSRRGMETTVNYPFKFTPEGPPKSGQPH